jgi:DNA-binding winged helix-turn-helix (wHTH) protein/tetratricopeptide (TPR) repeat protein
MIPQRSPWSFFMATPVRHSPVIRFGGFELDAANGELRKAGIPLKLHPQPFRALLLLAERRGQIVSREEIQLCLWGKHTTVDFEGGINFCIKQVRAVLGDDAERPRYIETLHRRGYRFIAPVSFADHRTNAIPFPPHTTYQELEKRLATPQCEQTSSAGGSFILPSAVPVTLPTGLRHRTAKVVLALFSVLAILIAGAIAYSRRPAKLTQKDTVVLADFVNKTGESIFDDALKQALATDLGQSRFFNVLSEKRAGETLRMMGWRPDEPVTAEVGRELCLRTGSKALLYGAISNWGTHYLLDLNAVACSTGDTLAKEQVEASGKEDVLGALNRASSRLRTQLGESLPSVQKFDVPIAATTNSLEALKNYSQAAKIGFEQGDAPGIPFLKRAIELDPNFAMAYVGLARRYSNLDQPTLALEYASKAYALRDQVTEREKLAISAFYFRSTGELEKLTEILNLWIASYPGDGGPHGSLGVNYSFQGQRDKALEESLEALRLDPDNVQNYINLSGVYLDLNQLDKAQATLEQAFARKFDGGGLRQDLYFLAFLHGDSSQMAQQVAWALGKPGDEAPLLCFQADTEAYYGRLKKARELSQRTIASAIRSDSKEEAALFQVIAALREAEFGETTQARRGVADALALGVGRDAKVLAALTLARTGDTVNARALLEELQKSYPSNTLLKIYWFPIVNAAIALQGKNPSQALDSLQPAAPYEIALSSSLERGTLYPSYLRGQAFLMQRNGAGAVAEFQKLLDHSGIVVNFVTAPLARLQIATAYALAGETTKAKNAYQDFFTLWKDADPDIPILKQARSEYAKLKDLEVAKGIE